MCQGRWTRGRDEIDDDGEGDGCLREPRASVRETESGKRAVQAGSLTYADDIVGKPRGKMALPTVPVRGVAASNAQDHCCGDGLGDARVPNERVGPQGSPIGHCWVVVHG
jgi:hypothetical protein